MKKHLSLVSLFLLCIFFTGTAYGSDFLVRDGDLQIKNTTPAVEMIDSNTTDKDIGAKIYSDATDTGSGTEDVDIYFQQMIAGLLTTWLHVDADGDIDFGTRNVTTSGTVSCTFTPAGLTNLYIPYMTTPGLVDSPLSTDGTDVTDSGAFTSTDLTTTGNTTLGDAAADSLTINATVVSTVNVQPTTAINALAIKTQEAAGATDGIVIVDSADAEVAAIDSDGNASFSGNITAANLAGVLAYGVRWDEDESSPTLTRLGTLANSPAAASPGNALLSVQSQMRRCVLSDAGVVQYYLKADDSYNRAGIPPSVTGTDDTGTASKLSDVGVFTGAAGEYVGRYVHDTTDDVYAMITAKDSDDVLSIATDIMANGDTFEICTAVLGGAGGSVMVEISKFAYKYSYDADLNVHEWWVAPVLMTGFEWHPAFYKDGAWVDHRYIGAYEGIGYDDSASAYIDCGTGAADNWSGTTIDVANDKLGSVSGFAPMMDETRDEFRDIALNRGAGWRQQDFYLTSAVSFFIWLSMLRSTVSQLSVWVELNSLVEHG